jgi:squalene-associated FAD-dependent desaturase
VNSSRTAAVIGAGWSGLAAALVLARAGRRVTVFEASRNLGGRARSVNLTDGPYDGESLRIDNGQHVLIGAYRETLRLMRVAGVDVDRALLRMPLDLHYADGFRMRAARMPYPLNLLSALLGCKTIRKSEAMRAMRMMAMLRLRKFRVQPDITVSELLSRHAQSDAIRIHLWEPLCVSALNTPPHRASAQIFANVLRDGLTGRRENSDLMVPRIDLGRLFPEPAVERLRAMGARVELGTPIRQITRRRNRFILDDREEEYATVILAVAPQHAGALLAGMIETQEARSRIDELAYEPIVTCYLQYGTEMKLPSPMLGFSGGLLQWAFDRGQLGNVRHAGLIAAVISASGAHEVFSSDTLATKVAEEISSVTGRNDMPRWNRVINEKRATWSCRPGVLRPAMRTPLPGLLLAGDYLEGEYPGTLEAAARNGVAAARAALED